jgi:hypothetical protein
MWCFVSNDAKKIVHIFLELKLNLLGVLKLAMYKYIFTYFSIAYANFRSPNKRLYK